MKIDGRIIAEKIKERLKKEIEYLPIVPHLAVVMVGNDPSSLAYVRQKEKIGKEIGAIITIFRFPKTVSANELFALVKKLNATQKIHGIIIQRPLPIDIDKEK